MTDQKISQLAEVSSLTGTELVPVVQGGASRRATVADIAALASGGGGGGTVTSVSVTPSDGVVASVETATETPNILIALGNITPDSVNTPGNVTAGGNVAATGTVTGSNLSGVNTGDNTVFVASGPSHAAGLVPDPGPTAGNTRVLHEDCVFRVPTARVSRLPFLTVTTMGDSYAAIGITNTSTAKGFRDENLMTQLRGYLGGRIHIPLANNLAVGATDLDTAIASLSAVIATNPDLVFLSSGRNNLASGGYTAAQCIVKLMTIISALMNAGIDVLILPVIQHSFGFTTMSWRQQMHQYNRFIYELCSGQRPDMAAAYGLPANRLPMAVDMRFMADNTNGYSLTDYVLPDNTHGTQRLWYEAVYRPDGVGPAFDKRLPPRVTTISTFDDYYSANFPTGNLITNGTTNRGLMTGTGGGVLNNAGLTPSGTVADGWQALRQLGDSTGTTMVCSKESTRADGMSGTGQRAVITVGTPGSVFAELYRFGYTGTINSGFSPGDKVYMHAEVELLADPVGFLGAGIHFAESGNVTNQAAFDGQASTGTGSRGATTKYRKTLRAPVITLGASTNQLSPYCYMWVRGAISSTLDIVWRDVSLRRATTA